MVTTVVNVTKPRTNVTQISGPVVRIGLFRYSNRWIRTTFRPKNAAKAMGMKSNPTNIESFLGLNLLQKRWKCNSKAVVFKIWPAITEGYVGICHFHVVQEKLRTRIIFFGGAQFFSDDAQFQQHDLRFILTCRKQKIVLTNVNIRKCL